MKKPPTKYVYVSAAEAQAKAIEIQKLVEFAPDETSKAMLVSIAKTWERIARANSTRH